VSFATITLCVASQRLLIVVSVYFVIDSVRKLLDTPSYTELRRYCYHLKSLCDRHVCMVDNKELKKYIGWRYPVTIFIPSFMKSGLLVCNILVGN